MEKKPYQLGVTVGRFQTFHNGHKMIIEKALQLCERVGILVGSSQESGTVMNPFSFEMRKSLLTKAMSGRVEVFPLPDIHVGNNGKWGEYVLSEAERYFGQLPDLAFSGKEGRRLTWFDNEKGKAIAEMYFPKTIEVSATVMREYLLRDERTLWQRFSPEELWGDYPRLREAVLHATDPNTDSI